jgi:hypothetical protein
LITAHCRQDEERKKYSPMSNLVASPKILILRRQCMKESECGFGF